MEKRSRGASSKEEDTASRDQIDRISMLPDELLVSVLSLLTFKEAAATSILSFRWRYLWTLTPNLDFDGFESMLKVLFAERNRKLLLDEERQKYVGWVNHVIKSHKASTIEKFRLYFKLNKSHKTDIDQWLAYALTKKVQRLELNSPKCCCYSYRDLEEYYSFPDELLSGPSSLGKCDSLDSSYLKEIIMCNVNVRGEALEFFLRNCPLLEHLSVTGSRELSSLRVIGPFPSFKSLEIAWCYKLISVEIRDSNLVYLKYWGPRIHFVLENVPLLVEMYLGGDLTLKMDDVLSLFSSCLPQLHMFKIDRVVPIHSWEAKWFCSAAKMRNLKQLVVKIYLYGNSLQALTDLICVSPCLQRFVVQASGTDDYDFMDMDGDEIDDDDDESVRSDLKKVKKIPRTYTRLKEVVVLGYRGLVKELELVIHFMENAVGLEKVIIDSRKRCEFVDDYKLMYKQKETVEEEIAARTRAREQLMDKVPPTVNLEIL